MRARWAPAERWFAKRWERDQGRTFVEAVSRVWRDRVGSAWPALDSSRVALRTTCRTGRLPSVPSRGLLQDRRRNTPYRRGEPPTTSPSRRRATATTRRNAHNFAVHLDKVSGRFAVQPNARPQCRFQFVRLRLRADRAPRGGGRVAAASALPIGCPVETRGPTRAIAGRPREPPRAYR